MCLNLSNGLKMPIIGLGTSGSSEAQLEKAIDAALEAGYRHIDTASAYNNEAVIGRVLQKWLKSEKLKREDLFITSKLPLHGLHPDRIELCLKKSLSNLQLDYIDLYLIHIPVCTDQEGRAIFETKTDHGAVWKKMEEQVEAKRAKSIGLSNHNVAQIKTVLKSARIKPASLQTEVHVCLQQKNLVDFCHKNGITVMAFCPLGSPNYNEKIRKYFPTYNEKVLPNLFENATILELAQKHSKNAAQIMLRFLMQLGIGALPKSETPQRIKDNLNIFDFSLDHQDMAKLRGLEVGEAARITDFMFLTGIEKHPDYPFTEYRNLVLYKNSKEMV